MGHCEPWSQPTNLTSSSLLLIIEVTKEQKPRSFCLFSCFWSKDSTRRNQKNVFWSSKSSPRSPKSRRRHMAGLHGLGTNRQDGHHLKNGGQCITRAVSFLCLVHLVLSISWLTVWSLLKKLLLSDLFRIQEWPSFRWPQEIKKVTLKEQKQTELKLPKCNDIFGGSLHLILAVQRVPPPLRGIHLP